MGNTQFTVRHLAPASFLFDFAAQQHGMFSKPNTLDIHNKNLAAFSPYPYAIACVAVEAMELGKHICRPNLDEQIRLGL